MSTFNHPSAYHICDLATALDAFTDAGIDPAFDSETEELERQFDDLRLQLACSND